MKRFSERLLELDLSAKSAEDVRPATDPSNISMLYVHIPFCKELCPFCSFNRQEFDHDLATRYFRHLRNELELYHAEGYRFTTMYIGGGTPTVLPGELADLIAYSKTLWPISEISVETTPADLQPHIIDLLRYSGVRRLSVGVQSFQDDLLVSANRFRKYGSGSDIEAKLTSLKGQFDTVNVDLIFGLEGQTLGQIRSDIDTIKRLAVGQVTCYPLMSRLEDIPPLRDWLARTRWEKKAYRQIREDLSPAYEASSAWCFSRSGGMIDEYIVEHPEYAGAGSGAFGFLNGCLVVNHFSIDDYLQKTAEHSPPALLTRLFSPGERLRYHLLIHFFRGKLDFAQLRLLAERNQRFLIWTARTLLRLSGMISRKGQFWQVSPRATYLAVLLMKTFFQSVSSLRSLCKTVVEKVPIDD